MRASDHSVFHFSPSAEYFVTPQTNGAFARSDDHGRDVWTFVGGTFADPPRNFLKSQDKSKPVSQTPGTDNILISLHDFFWGRPGLALQAGTD